MSAELESKPAEDEKSILAKEIDASQILLAYAVEHGKAIKKNQIDVLVHSQHVQSTGQLTEQEEAAFWDAYRALCASTTPVSRTSLDATTPRRQKTHFRVLERSKADLVVSRNQVLSVIAIALLLAFQTLWFFVSTVLKDIHELDTAINETDAGLSTVDLKIRLASYEGGADRWDKDYSQQIAELNAEKARFENDWKLLQDEWKANMQFLRRVNLLGLQADAKSTARGDEIKALEQEMKLLEREVEQREVEIETAWNDLIAEYPYLKKLGGIRAATGIRDHNVRKNVQALREQMAKIEALGDEYGEKKKVKWKLEKEESDESRQRDRYQIQTSGILRDTIFLYLLPILYGWVGACAHILRTLSKQIRQRTFASSFRALRMILGALAGLSIAWFVKPSTDVPLVNNLSPLALAFLGGYSIELVFQAMDTLIAAFSKGSAAPNAELD